MKNEDIKYYDLPEETKVQILDKIEAASYDILFDWTDPRTQCRVIIRLCKKLKESKSDE